MNRGGSYTWFSRGKTNGMMGTASWEQWSLLSQWSGTPHIAVYDEHHVCCRYRCIVVISKSEERQGKAEGEEDESQQAEPL